MQITDTVNTLAHDVSATVNTLAHDVATLAQEAASRAQDAAQSAGGRGRELGHQAVDFGRHNLHHLQHAGQKAGILPARRKKRVPSPRIIVLVLAVIAIGAVIVRKRKKAGDSGRSSSIEADRLAAKNHVRVA